jgi:hypothetical protein
VTRSVSLIRCSTVLVRSPITSVDIARHDWHLAFSGLGAQAR